jgi:lipoprotein-anchoring transpeptidase ErfK/SrfK
VVVACLAALVPAIPIIVGLAITSGGSPATRATTPGFTPVTATAPPATAPAPRTPGAAGALVALVHRPTAMRSAPGGTTLAGLSTRTEFGSPEALWVVAQKPGWLGVVSQLAGNGHIGWIPASSASLTRVTWEIQISLSARRLTVVDSGRALVRYMVAVGRPAAPTPTGRFAVTDRLFTGNPAGPYGCCILALSAHSPHTIQGWTGGDRIAIHSTSDSSSIGDAVSHGCLRLTLAEGRWLMSHIPLGTPTIIRT